MNQKRLRLNSPAKVINYLNKSYDALKMIGVEKRVLDDFKELIKYLKGYEEDDPNTDLFQTTMMERRSYSNMGVDEIEGIIKVDDVSKKTMEQIAIERFSIPRGGMSKLNRGELRGHLQTLIENERTHLAIERMASEKKISPENGD